MELEKLEQMIFDFFDGELDAESEREMFEELSRNPEGREFFKNYTVMKNAADASREEFPQAVDDKITEKIQGKMPRENERGKTNSYWGRLAVAIAVAASVLFALFTYSSLKNYEKELYELKRIARYQNRTIKMIMNGLPEIDVRSKPDNEIVIQSKL